MSAAHDLPPPPEEHRAVDFDERPRLWDDPRRIRLAFVLFSLACAGVLVADLLVHRHLTFAHGEETTAAHEPTLHQEGWFGFYGIYGFVGIVLLVVLSVVLRLVVKRGENYYGEGPSR